MAFFKAIYSFFAKILSLIFGNVSWVPPFWLRPICKLFSLIGCFFKRYTKSAIASVFVLIVAIGAGIGGWIWYQNQPLPYMVSYDYSNPPLSDYDKKGVKTYPLTIEFSDSVAPIDKVNTTIEEGVSLSPQIKGTWHWSNDKVLTFKPQQDWPIDQKYTVSLAQKGLFTDGILLKDYSFDVTTSPFAISVNNSKLYEDPQDPNQKKMVAEIKASHPIDQKTFAKHISFELSRGLTYQNKTNNNPQIFFSEDGLTASVQSAILSMPLETSTVKLKVSKGVTSNLGGNASTEEFSASIDVPGRYQLSFGDAKIDFVRNNNGEPEPIFMFESSKPVSDTNIDGQVTAWALPQRKNESGDRINWRDNEITDNLLARSRKIPLIQIPSDSAQNSLHSFKLNAEPGVQLYVRINGKIQSQGGYLSRDAQTLYTSNMPNYPKTLQFMSEGALLGLRGERTLGVMAQGVSGAQVEIARVLPKQLHHLVNQLDGNFVRPDMSESEFDTLVERENIDFDLPDIAVNKMQYSYVDLAPYLSSEDGRHGIFVVRMSEKGSYDRQTLGEVTSARDIRFIVVTDIGIIAKRDSNRGHDIFVQSIETGLPIDNALVEVYGVNGLPVAQSYSDETGHAYFGDLSELSREKRPLMYVVTNGEDQSFLPINNEGRQLDLSRFAIGGLMADGKTDTLRAFMFSERGLYRPGETVHLGMIVRRDDWHGNLQGLPVELTIYDPARREVKTEKMQLSAEGFESYDFASDPAMPAGTYTAELELANKSGGNYSLGSVSFSIRDFEPDRMKVTASLSPTPIKGWLKPEEVKASVKAMHLFGAPAGDRRTSMTMRMEPAFVGFDSYRDYRFYLENTLDESHVEDLADQKTDENGIANFNLDLNRFTASGYKLQVLARVFEADGGRNVAADASALVSPADYMVGVKSDDNLDYVNKGTQRRVNWLAVNANLKPIGINGLRREVVEVRYVSVLVKQYDDTYRYASRKKEVVLENKPFSITENGTIDTLDTSNPGEFIVKIKNGDTVLNQLNYSVAGDANLSRSLDRSSELTLKLNKTSYKPGEFIEINIRAPYVGAGLITIERDKVYAHSWFKTDTTSSVQYIELPEGLEGNAYINVQFVRSPQSDEIFMSPLSYGVAPFAISLDNRTTNIAVTTPKTVEPGDDIAIKVNLNRPSQVMVWGVDEGILQVARYSQPRPLDFFFKKRALEVETTQILDLILPEFSKLFLAASGGDDEGALSNHLNPFKRKNKPPVVYWSGIQDMPKGESELNWQVPDYFNGKVHFFAVAVDQNHIGIAQSYTESKAPIVLTPNVPAFVAPGDVVNVSMGAFSNLASQDVVSLTIEPSRAFEIIGDKTQQFTVDPLKEATANWQLKASNDNDGNKLGAHDIKFVAKLADGRSFTMVENVSVRPLSERRVQLSAKITNDKVITLEPTRKLYSQLSKVEASFGYSPLNWATGLNQYLDNYAYVCTEQTISKTMPSIIFGKAEDSDAAKNVANTLTILGQRMNSSGGLGQWNATPDSDIFATLYAVDFMLDAQERGFYVASQNFERTRAFLKDIAEEPPFEGMNGFRLQAYAIYLLNRQAQSLGISPSFNELANLRERLDTYYEKKDWQKDTTAVYMAASYLMFKQNKEANALVNSIDWQLLKNNEDSQYYFDDALTHDSETITILGRYFPNQLSKIPNEVWQKIADNLQSQRYNSLSSALLIRAASIYENSVQNSGASIEAAVKQNNDQTSGVTLEGSPSKAILPFDFKSLTLTKSRSDLPGFVLLSEAGYDINKSQEPRNNGIDIFHDYTDLKGNKIDKVNVGDEFLVRVRMRSTGQNYVGDVAIVDLLPGGVELVYRQPNHSQSSDDDESGDENGDEGDDGNEYDSEGDEEQALPAVGEPDQSDWQPHFIDPRDDRVVLYGSLDKEVGTFTYKVRAINAGQFTIPAAFAESMYNPQINGEGAIGKLIIEVK
ncbi:alpha-2-macroglobulin [Bartonella sp. HY406]|uniref:alpha-2-macroglobulin n=1 Tax=Bartonella sp. HY406 TaxID=2979331 RepID=UPI0021C5BB4D|nr:alpha-2-macroglobulin [Bartonella sp. HY406]UXN04868.1 alpha-2-macroglobulin [Bartonella sp. HY406]